MQNIFYTDKTYVFLLRMSFIKIRKKKYRNGIPKYENNPNTT